MTSGKYPKCECETKKYDYFRIRYRNQTLHLLRRCAECGKPAQNPMRKDEYDRSWVDTLPIMADGVMEQPEQPEQSMESRRPAPKTKTRVQSHADAIMAKLQKHIGTRNANL